MWAWARRGTHGCAGTGVRQRRGGSDGRAKGAERTPQIPRAPRRRAAASWLLFISCTFVKGRCQLKAPGCPHVTVFCDSGSVAAQQGQLWRNLASDSHPRTFPACPGNVPEGGECSRTTNASLLLYDPTVPATALK